jgi:NADPH:quinone reductase-like Zn-dependent oxidoreductase
MTTQLPSHGLQLTSTVTDAGDLQLRLVEVPVPEPRPDQVVIRVEATPINPSDLGVLLGPADPIKATFEGPPERPTVSIPLAPVVQQALARRKGRALPVGNEGAGVVVAAGENARNLLGRRVAALAGGMYAQYRVVAAEDCLVLPENVTPAEAASAFVNPLTVLAMIETMRLEGHTGLIHTAAASNLGQMLVKVCREDRVALVNIVRRPEQAETLRALGATHVCDSSAPDFRAALVRALEETGATLAFDAIGGGRMASEILLAIEAVALKRVSDYSPYGSSQPKQVYVYGRLDPSPTEISSGVGMMWAVGGWLMPPILHRLGPERTDQLRRRVLAGVKTTFASAYSREISLAEALKPDVMAAYARKATGEKFLINPAR